MQIMPNKGSTNYYPNTLGGGLPEQAPKTGVPEEPFVEGKIVRKRIRKTDDYTQAGERYRAMSKIEREHLVSNIVGALSHATIPIQKRMLVHFFKADGKFGERVKAGLGL